MSYQRRRAAAVVNALASAGIIIEVSDSRVGVDAVGTAPTVFYDLVAYPSAMRIVDRYFVIASTVHIWRVESNGVQSWR